MQGQTRTEDSTFPTPGKENTYASTKIRNKTNLVWYIWQGCTTKHLFRDRKMFFIIFLKYRVSLCSLSWPWTHRDLCLPREVLKLGVEELKDYIYVCTYKHHVSAVSRVQRRAYDPLAPELWMSWCGAGNWTPVVWSGRAASALNHEVTPPPSPSVVMF